MMSFQKHHEPTHSWQSCTKRFAVLSGVVASVTLATTVVIAQPHDTRPDPVDPVLTPFGIADRSCVHEIDDGEIVRPDKQTGESAVTSRSGEKRRSLPSCKYATIKNKSEHVPAVNGWLAAEAVDPVGSNGDHWLNGLTATWTVPPNPSQNGGTLFLFNAAQTQLWDIIIQPVLEWNNTGNNTWTIASWAGGNAYGYSHGTRRTVQPGNTIYGSIWAYDCDVWLIRGMCVWDITTMNLANFEYSYLEYIPNDSMKTAFGGVAEAYNITSCNRLPNGSLGSTAFSSIQLYLPTWDANDHSLHNVQGGDWYGLGTPGGTPQCNYGGSPAYNYVTISY